ncbi:MAG TPA: DinB family protein [Actinotalea sp.]|nr:DinB family protein [Actinotalea sp.]
MTTDRQTDAQGRVLPPTSGDEVSTLLAFLDFHRETIAWKTEGLDAAALAAAHPPTTMTLGGILKHLAGVEDWWFSQVLHGNPEPPPWDAVDWRADPDWDWHSAVDDTPDELRALWRGSVDKARHLIGEALADGGLDRPARVGPHGDPPPSLRWLVVHMIEEYARHNGHVDLLREAVDGLVGE